MRIGFSVNNYPAWHSAVGTLRDNYAVEPCFFAGDDRIPDGWSQKQASVYGAPFVSMHDVEATMQDSLRGNNWVQPHLLGQDELEKHSSDLVTLSRIARRYFPTRSLTPARSVDQFAVTALDLANSIIETSRPQAVVLNDVGHLILDYALRAVAAQKSIDVVEYRWSWDSEIYQPLLNGEPLDCESYLDEEPRLQVRESLHAYLSTVDREYDQYLLSAGVERDRPRSLPHSYGGGISAAKRKLRTGLSIIGRNRGGRERSIYRAQRNQGGVELAAFRFVRGLQSKRLRSTYERCSTSENFPRKYAYFAFHYQPEATTLPLAGSTVDQVRMALYLRAILPPEICLVIKEHPRQFQKGWEGSKERSPADYLKLCETRGVLLAPLGSDPFSLIDSSLFVITVSGTVGAEAIARGRRVLLLGRSWFEKAPGVMRLETLLSAEVDDLSVLLANEGFAEDRGIEDVLSEFTSIAGSFLPGNRRGSQKTKSLWALSEAGVPPGLHLGAVAALGLGKVGL